jgi:hypothetical protein
MLEQCSLSNARLSGLACAQAMPRTDGRYARTYADGLSPTRDNSPLVTRARAYEILPDRFTVKVDFQDCWICTAAKDSTGYGVFSIGSNRNAKAHRFAYAELVGEIPDGMECDHVCRNRACVNPNHIDIVTHRENLLRIRTRTAKGNLVSVSDDPTECPMGHRWSEFGSRHKDGYLRCRACASDRERARRASR